MGLRFKWGRKKAATNITDHRVSFDEASTVFYDPLAKIFDDEAHSITERREIIIGHSKDGRLLLVCFTEPEEDVIRIFSAREPTKKERKDYEENVY